MKLIALTAVTVILAPSAVLAQTAAPAAPRAYTHRTSGMAVTDAQATAATARSELLMQQRVEEMKTTVTKMHALLKEMQTKAAASRAKDPVAKANLEMWELMVGQLDKQFAELAQAARMRSDMEVRRQAMYKQAEERTAEAAQKAREASAAQMNKAGASSANPAAPAVNPNSAQPSAQQSNSTTAPSASSPSPN